MVLVPAWRITGLVALVFGVLILAIPRLLGYLVAIYLILFGLLALLNLSM